MLGYLFYHWERKLARRDTNRKVREFDWGVDFLPNGITQLDPRTRLIEAARRTLQDSDSYHSYNPVRDYRLHGSHLTFSSPVQTPYEKNNTVHGRYFPTDSKGRVVLVLPQWNSDAGGHMALCRMLNKFGLSALRLSMPYHDLRMPEGLVRADYMLSPNLGRTLQAVRQAVIDSRAAIDWLESQGYRRFAVLGTSLGSCVALITMAHEPRIAVSVQNHISPYFADVVWEGISTSHVKAGLTGHITLEELREIWLPISPKAYLPKLAGTGKKSLLIHAAYDHSFPPPLSQAVLRDYRRLGLPHQTLMLPCGHYTSGEFPFNIALGFAMCNYLRKQL
jgi:dienelactone hydrolase